VSPHDERVAAYWLGGVLGVLALCACAAAFDAGWWSGWESRAVVVCGGAP
jgi:hypothetical protein